MPMEAVGAVEAANGAAEQEQNPSSAPPASTMGTLDTSLTTTADPGLGLKDVSFTKVPRAERSSLDSSSIGSTTQLHQSSLTDLTRPEWDTGHDRDTSCGVVAKQPPASGHSIPVEQEHESGSIRSTDHASDGIVIGIETSRNMNSGTSNATPASRGRTKGPGRPRGFGRIRGGGNTGRMAKRKRKDDDDNEDDDDGSDSSEVYTPIATTTKSGRNVQKPTAYVPPPAQSPVNSNKRKRTYRKNPESAVCKVCLRGTSPASNMIVFCDGCNTPYHRYCHHPPIDQAVVDEVDMEWYCKQCEKRRVAPVPESEIAGFVSAEGSSLEERRKYFSRMKPGMMVTLLARATTIQPDLPLFDPDFGAKHSRAGTISKDTPGKPSNAPPQPSRLSPTSTLLRDKAYKTWAEADEDDVIDVNDESDDEGYDPSFHPPHYPKPGQGLMSTLPPDKDDTERLVDDRDHLGAAFTHIYQADPATANAGIGDSHPPSGKAPEKDTRP